MKPESGVWLLATGNWPLCSKLLISAHIT